MPDLQRHAGHGPDVTCRPAGYGLCEPAPDPGKLTPWRDALAEAARRGKQPPPAVTGVRAATGTPGEVTMRHGNPSSGYRYEHYDPS